MKSTTRRGLRTLFAPLTVRDFIKNHWPQRALVRHGDPARIGALRDDPRLARPQALADAHRGPIQTIGTTSQDTHAQMAITRDQVSTLADRGMSIKFDEVDRTIEEVDVLCTGLARDLGVDRSACYCQAFFSCKGERVALHFDSVEVFVIQLRGRKRWRHAENTEVRYPLNPWAPGVTSSRDHGLVAPEGFDPDVTTRTSILRPGSAMFIPRGWWHGTEALDEDCVSLSVMVHTPTWLEVGLRALRRRLLASEQWRQPIAHDLTQAAGLRQFVSAAESMLDSARDLTGDLAPMDLAPARPRRLHASMRLVLRPGTTLTTADEQGRAVVRIVRPGLIRTIAVGEQGAQLCRFVASRSGPFTVRSARAVVPEFDGDRVLLALVSVGAIQPSSPPQAAT